MIDGDATLVGAEEHVPGEFEGVRGLADLLDCQRAVKTSQWRAK